MTEGGADDGTVGAGAGMGTVGTVATLCAPATAAAAAAAYLIGGSIVGFNVGTVVNDVGSAGFAGSLGATGGGAGGGIDIPSGFVSKVGFLKGCFFAKTGLGGCSSEGVVTGLLAGVSFFSLSSFAGVFGASMGSAIEAESRLDISSLCENSWVKSSSSCRLRSS